MNDLAPDQAALRKAVQAFLGAQPKGVFGVVDEKGQPTTSLMLYAVDDELRVYFGTKRSSAKYAHIIAHPVVSLTVLDGTPDPLRVADLRGTAAEVPTESLAEAFTLFKARNTAKYYVEGADDFTMFKLTPDFMRFLDATSGQVQVQNVPL
jgi:general stress protein 26